MKGLSLQETDGIMAKILFQVNTIVMIVPAQEGADQWLGASGHMKQMRATSYASSGSWILTHEVTPF